MIPAAFEYQRAISIEDALARLARPAAPGKRRSLDVSLFSALSCVRAAVRATSGSE